MPTSSLRIADWREGSPGINDIPDIYSVPSDDSIVHAAAPVSSKGW